ncbi:MAG: 5-(carboxyamino)imidazole ribonucleotide synthase [Bacteroidales bacterium]|nr:5-(carboxyamino)imidazole ribonucleotide synthase [Bacteroidales bacterium]
MQLKILGGGQLGRMITLAGYPLGVRTTVLDPATDPCAGQVCPHIVGEYEDYRALYELAQSCDAVTFEFENVPVASARWLAERVPVFPPPQALEVSQDRLIEKSFLRDLGVPVPPFAAVETRADFDAALQSIGLPAVLKTRRFGYDGKGQYVLRSPADAETAWVALGGRPLILEGFVPFDREVSLICVRGREGSTAFYPLTENEHREGMLYRSLAPVTDTAEELTERAQEYALRILDALQYVGVLAIEWFQDGGQLLANEMAPRVHNSGHWTIEGAVTSQFENHVRAVLGLPLGSTEPRGYSAMFNLIGHHPPIPQLLALPAAKLHSYGKGPRPRRKIGHVTFVEPTAAQRDQHAAEFAQLLG